MSRSHHSYFTFSHQKTQIVEQKFIMAAQRRLANPMVATSYQKYFLDESSADVKFLFVLEDGTERRIAAHKIILAAKSPVFHSMFFGEMKEIGDITIVGASCDAFVEFLQFFYLDNLTLTLANIAEVMALADRYLVPMCLDICETFFTDNLELNNIWLGIELADMYSRTEMKGLLLSKICINLRDAFASASSSQCSHGLLKEILQSDLKCPPMQIFAACLKWAEHKCAENGLAATMENRKEQLGDFIQLIPFKLMSPGEINDCVTKYNPLFDTVVLTDIVKVLTTQQPKTLPPKTLPPKTQRPKTQRPRTYKFDDFGFDDFEFGDFGVDVTEYATAHF